MADSQQELLRAKQLERNREEKKKAFESQKCAMKADGASGLRKIDQMFATTTTSIETQFKQATVGLVSAEEYAAMRAELELSMQTKLNETKDQDKKKKKDELVKKKAVLSFDLDEDEDADTVPVPKRAKLKKDPDVDTSFLPDQERDEKENKERILLAQEWTAEQERVKSEVIEVTYSYWDGSGHRNTLRVKKGQTIGMFLEMARRQIADEFTELRTIDSSNLVYVKEDLIIPHNYTFYDFIISKARGKSGPLFHFDIRADVRLVGDIRLEKEDSHAGKIVTRSFLDKHRHIFPYSRFEVYDSTKEYSRYTIHGDEAVDPKKM